MRSIVLVDRMNSPNVSPSDLDRLVRALNIQQDRDYAELWQNQGAAIRVGSDADLDPNDVVINLIFDPPVPSELGDHTVDAQGRPVGEVALNPVIANGGAILEGPNAWSTVVSHEVCELRGNPYVQWLSALPDGSGFEPLELADRTEGDSYEIEGVAVSNILGPRAFSSGPGTFDQMGLLETAGEIRPSGYQSIIHIGDGTVTQVFGYRFPVWKIAHKKSRALRKMGALMRKLGLSRTVYERRLLAP